MPTSKTSVHEQDFQFNNTLTMTDEEMNDHFSDEIDFLQDLLSAATVVRPPPHERNPVKPHSAIHLYRIVVITSSNAKKQNALKQMIEVLNAAHRIDPLFKIIGWKTLFSMLSLSSWLRKLYTQSYA